MKKYFGLLLSGMGALCLISTPLFAMGKKPPATAGIVTSFSCYDKGSGVNGAFIGDENTIDLKEGTVTRLGQNLVRKITSTSIQQLSDGSGYSIQVHASLTQPSESFQSDDVTYNAIIPWVLAPGEAFTADFLDEMIFLGNPEPKTLQYRQTCTLLPLA